jgi:hypothetical protein
LAVAIVAAGCDNQPAAPKPITGYVALAPGAYALYTGGVAAGPLRFPAADAAGAEYLLVGQFATAQGDLSSSFSLAGSPPPAASVARAPAPRSGPPAAVRFHDAIRRMDEAAARASLRVFARGESAVAAARAGPPVVGSQRTFKVCTSLDCSSTASVTASAEVVGAHNAIYLDLLAPPTGGFALPDLQQLSTQFDDVLYPVDTLAFGSPSDIDGNGMVIILLTPRVNALVGRPDCQSSFVTGYFLAADLAPATRGSWNNGEVFYAMVPDLSGTVSCGHAANSVMRLIPPTFIHEFQHMISFNQHVLARRGAIEVLWLNEAMSHLAEELGGRHYDSLGMDSTAARFHTGNLYNAYLYLLNPAAWAMVTTAGTDDLQSRGGQWLFVRYLVDQYGAGTSQRLEQTSLTGAANVVSAAGNTGFPTLLGRWALALYVSDLPSFTPDARLRYLNWSFRSTFENLHLRDGGTFVRDFPLIPAPASGGSFGVSGTVNSGSGTYVDLVQNAGDPSFTVSFTEPGGLALNRSGNPQLAIVRVR